MGGNNGGGARWHLMARAVCPRCGLSKPVGVTQLARNGGECINRGKCAKRAARRALLLLKDDGGRQDGKVF